MVHKNDDLIHLRATVQQIEVKSYGTRSDDMED